MCVCVFVREPVQKGRRTSETMSERRRDAGTAPCIAPRALRGHPSSKLKSCSAHYTTPAPIKTSLQKHHHITPPQTHYHTTNTTTPPQKHHHHNNNKTPLGIEPMTSCLLSGCNANWAKLSLPWGSKGPIITLRGAEKKVWNWKKVPPPHHRKNTTTPNTK